MTAHIIVSGFVQGIGFRNYIKSKSRKLGLLGWVKNISDGKVEAEFVGSKEKIDQIIAISNKGPFLAQVKDVKVDWKDSDKNYSSFDIIH